MPDAGAIRLWARFPRSAGRCSELLDILGKTAVPMRTKILLPQEPGADKASLMSNLSGQKDTVFIAY